MDSESNIKKMQQVSSRLTEDQRLKWMHDNEKFIDAEMKKLRQQRKAEDEMFLKELPDEIREEVFMILIF